MSSSRAPAPPRAPPQDMQDTAQPCELVERHAPGKTTRLSQEEFKEQQSSLSRRTTPLASVTNPFIQIEQHRSHSFAKDSTDNVADLYSPSSSSISSSSPTTPSSSSLPPLGSPVRNRVKSPYTPSTPPPRFHQAQETLISPAPSPSSSDEFASYITSSETLVRSFSCALPRPPPAASTALSNTSPSRVKRPSPLRQTSAPLPAGSASPSKMPSASSHSMTPSLSSASMNSTSSSSSDPSLSNFGMGGQDLPRPILRHYHSHSVVRTSSPLRQQVGFEEQARSPVAKRSSLSNGAPRARRGRNGSKVTWAQTVHGGMESLLGYDSQPELSQVHHSAIGSRPSTFHERPSTLHERQPSMDRTPRIGGSTLRNPALLSARAMPGNRPASAPMSGLWSDASDEIPANHPSTAMPGFPAMEFSDMRAPKFSRAGLRNSGVIMPVAAGRPRSTISTATAPPRVVKEVKFEKTEKVEKTSGLSGMVRKLSRRATSSPALKDKAAEQTRVAPPLVQLQKRPSPLQRSASTDQLRTRTVSVVVPERRAAPQHLMLPTSAPRPERFSLGPRSAPPPSTVYGQLPPGCGLPSDHPPPPQQFQRPHAPQWHQPQPRHAQGPPRPQLRHFRSSPGLRPVPLEPLPEVSPTSPPLSPPPRMSMPPVTYEPLAHTSPMHKPARIPAFDDYSPRHYAPPWSVTPEPSSMNDHNPGRPVSPVPRIQDRSPVLALPELPGLGMPFFSTSEIDSFAPTTPVEDRHQFMLPDLPGSSTVADPSTTPKRRAASDNGATTPPRCSSAFSPESLLAPMGQHLSLSAPPTPNLSTHVTLPGAPEVTSATPNEPVQPPPRRTSLAAMGSSYLRTATTGFASQTRNRSRSPSTFSVCSEASLHSTSTASSQRSISSLTSASSAASVDMPDPIAEHEDDADAGIKVASASASVDSHTSSIRSAHLVNDMITRPLPSPVDGAIIKMVTRARAEPAVAMHL